jgi:hypothetical protein
MMEQRMVGRLDFELGLVLLAVAFRVALRGEEESKRCECYQNTTQQVNLNTEEERYLPDSMVTTKGRQLESLSQESLKSLMELKLDLR